MPKFEKYILSILLLIFLSATIYWFQDKTISFTMFDKPQTELETLKINEFNNLNNVSVWFSENIQKVIDQNQELINKDNCSGLLYDQNEDNIYDKKIMGISFQNESNYVVHYNFCSYVWKKEKSISLILTSKNLIKNFTETQGDLSFIPAMIYNKNIDTNREDVSFGLIDTRDIM